jgi:hypothetical protein
VPVFGDEDVSRFDVAMDDSLLVRLRQARGQLHYDVDGFAGLQLASRDPFLERLPIVVRHRDEHMAVVGLRRYWDAPRTMRLWPRE